MNQYQQNNIFLEWVPYFCPIIRGDPVDLGAWNFVSKY